MPVETASEGKASSFPLTRLLYAAFFAVVGWFAFMLILWVALLQWILRTFNDEPNAEVKRFSAGLIQYLWEILAFISFAKREKPFPFAPFPEVANPDVD